MKLELVGEFVLTYSWGLLILGVVVSSMLAFGYLDFSSLSSEKCLAAHPFECISAESFNSSRLDVVLRNHANTTEIYALNFISTPSCGGISNASVNNDLLPYFLPPRDIGRIRLSCTSKWKKGESLEGSFIVFFRNSTGRFNSSVDLKLPVKG